MVMESSGCGAPGLSDLCPDLWVKVLSFLGPRDLGTALCTCRATCAVSQLAWKAACERRWPRWAEIAVGEPDDVPTAYWRRIFEVLVLREREGDSIHDVQAIRRRQAVVTEGHRAMLVEWLCEVSFDWNLETSIVFEAITYLDYYLAHTSVLQIGRFQLLGLGCLRGAMLNLVSSTEQQLDPHRFANISDDTYTAAEVEDSTQDVQSTVPASFVGAPNAKMFLRGYWYRAIDAGVAAPEEMHIYATASFLLQLSLLDLPSAAFAPSQRAAAALSLAFDTFGKASWPATMQRFGSHLLADLLPCRARLQEAQASLKVTQLRGMWRLQYKNHTYDEFGEEWGKVLKIMACPGGTSPGSTFCQSTSESASDSDASAGTALVQDMRQVQTPSLRLPLRD